jgi:catechol 2,3-dioxygenase-like lactoylglutathione lyase family enzyme
MIGYITLGTNDFKKAVEFYEKLNVELGATRMDIRENFTLFMPPSFSGGIAICAPHDGNSANNGNGTMVALKGKDQDHVGRVHELALSLGAKDEGAPGFRGTQGFYGAYFRDLDNNKLAIYVIVRPS